MQKVKAPIPVPILLKKTIAVFHKYIKERDSNGDYFTCISCGQIRHISQFNAGHYLSANSSPALKFDPDNVHGEERNCNFYKKDNTVYRKNLISKIGLEMVLSLMKERTNK